MKSVLMRTWCEDGPRPRVTCPLAVVEGDPAKISLAAITDLCTAGMLWKPEAKLRVHCQTPGAVWTVLANSQPIALLTLARVPVL